MSNINTKVTVDTTQVNSNLNQVKNFVRGWATDLRGQIVGAFAVGAAISSIRNTVDTISGIGDAASRLDVGVEFMQALGLMAKNANLELSKVEKLLNSIGDAQMSALTNPSSESGQKAVNSFGAVGISREQLAEMNGEKLFKAMIEGMNAKGISGTKSIQSTMPMFNSKEAGIINSLLDDLKRYDAYVKENISKGTIVDKETVMRLKQSADDLSNSWTGLKNTSAGLIIGILNIISTILSTFRLMADGVAVAFLGVFKAINKAISFIAPFAIDTNDWDERIGKGFEKMGAKTGNDWNDLKNIWKSKKIEAPENPAPGTPASSNGKSANDNQNSNFDLFGDKEKKGKGLNIYSDPLLAKGNMLGQGLISNSVNYAADQLKVQKDIHRVLLKQLDIQQKNADAMFDLPLMA